MSEEIILVGLHNALKLLGEITGETTTEDILTQIFSTFCIGK
jgi:tRNA modification GTPase